MIAEKQVDGDDEQVMYLRAYAMSSYLLYLVGTPIFVDKSSYYVDVIYLKYVTDLKRIHKYNWGVFAGVFSEQSQV